MYGKLQERGGRDVDGRTLLDRIREAQTPEARARLAGEFISIMERAELHAGPADAERYMAALAQDPGLSADGRDRILGNPVIADELDYLNRTKDTTKKAQLGKAIAKNLSQEDLDTFGWSAGAADAEKARAEERMLEYFAALRRPG